MLIKINKKREILIFCMIFVVKSLSAQHFALKDSASKAFINFPRLNFSPIRSQNYTIRPVAANFYVKNLGFFCLQELKLEAVTRIPFRFRLGSVNYCNWMEGKPNAGILPGN